MRELRPDFDRLAIDWMDLPQRVYVGPVALLTTLAEPDLCLADIALQVIVNDIEVLERWELRVWSDRRLDEELALLGVDIEPVTGVNANPLAHAVDEPVHLQVEVGRVVDDIEVRMTDPRGSRIVIQFPRQLHAFRSAGVILSMKTISYSYLLQFNRARYRICQG